MLPPHGVRWEVVVALDDDGVVALRNHGVVPERLHAPTLRRGGTGRIRTIRIGTAAADAERVGDAIDYQPCGGTHVANTSEIGAVVVTRIEKKSATTRRVVLGFA